MLLCSVEACLYLQFLHKLLGSRVHLPILCPGSPQSMQRGRCSYFVLSCHGPHSLDLLPAIAITTLYELYHHGTTPLISTRVKSVADISSEQKRLHPHWLNISCVGETVGWILPFVLGGHSSICVNIFCGGEGKDCHPFVWRRLAATHPPA